MKRLMLTAAVLAATLIAPSFASAGDRYRGYSRSRDYGHHGRHHYRHDHGHYHHGHRGRSSFNFSFGLFSGPRHYRPVYREVYVAPPPVYYAPARVYYPPARHYHRPVYRSYDRYYDNCDYYGRPSTNFSFSYGRYYR